jgi:hypothetical protein
MNARGSQLIIEIAAVFVGWPVMRWLTDKDTI